MKGHILYLSNPEYQQDGTGNYASGAKLRKWTKHVSCANSLELSIQTAALLDAHNKPYDIRTYMPYVWWERFLRRIKKANLPRGSHRQLRTQKSGKGARNF
eukprot:14394976-Ditylum_brightwellii.AAC.1